jgi:membrane-associated phospholipid phosphatase
VFRLSAALAAAYATLAVLVATGATNGLDQWSVEHLMPGLGDAATVPSKTEAVVPLLHASWDTPLAFLGNVVTLPAQAAIGSALAAACWVVLMRRGRTHAALAWIVAWVAANAVEVLCKSVLSRPLLHHDGAPLWAFQASWPSGHTLRSVLLAATVAAVWPKAGRWAAAWAAATIVLLEVDGFHVPTDLAGGLLLALLAAGLARREAAYARS